MSGEGPGAVKWVVHASAQDGARLSTRYGCALPPALVLYTTPPGPLASRSQYLAATSTFPQALPLGPEGSASTCSPSPYANSPQTRRPKDPRPGLCLQRGPRFPADQLPDSGRQRRASNQLFHQSLMLTGEGRASHMKPRRWQVGAWLERAEELRSQANERTPGPMPRPPGLDMPALRQGWSGPASSNSLQRPSPTRRLSKGFLFRSSLKP